MSPLIFKIMIEALCAFFIATILFDCVHYGFHRGMRSKKIALKKLCQIHAAHHHFYSPSLQIKNAWAQKNLAQHVYFEYLTHVLGMLLFLWWFNPIAIALALTLESIIFINVCYHRGIDPHHQPLNKLPAQQGGLFVNARYHALHHINPNGYYSSYVKVLDYILGSAHQLKHKKIVMTGASGALGSHMKSLLEQEGANVVSFKYGADYTYGHYDKLIAELKTADILFLCHGSKYDEAQNANCTSFIDLIELYKSLRPTNLIPPEVWAVGSEIECHPCFGIKKLKVYAKSKRNFAQNARKYFHDPKMIYRHLVHSAFISRMGPGLMTARFAAKMTLFFIKRDFKYVPVTYTGFAFLNYFLFYLMRP